MPVKFQNFHLFATSLKIKVVRVTSKADNESCVSLSLKIYNIRNMHCRFSVLAEYHRTAKHSQNRSLKSISKDISLCTDTSILGRTFGHRQAISWSRWRGICTSFFLKYCLSSQL